MPKKLPNKQKLKKSGNYLPENYNFDDGVDPKDLLNEKSSNAKKKIKLWHE